ncbi:MAG: aminoacyl-tRNA hydrolase [Flavobacteriales bacterium]|nr:aminoacyl-tRNA hydrolase [Flavobacteriales bacterium]
MKPNLLSIQTELTFKTSRSGGSGGQNVNKVSTKVLLEFDVLNSKFLDDEQRAIIQSKLENKINSEGILQIVSQTERTQLKNKKIALEKFNLLISNCFLVRKERKATKVPKAVKEKRLSDKRIKSELKRWRQGKD